MTNKITLITPPDIYQNSNKSILLCHLSEKEQKIAAKFLESIDDQSVNLYVYDGQVNITWLFTAMGACQYKYIDLDNMNEITGLLSGFLVSKSDFYYKTDDANIASVYSFINLNRVDTVEDFLKVAFSDQNS